MLAAGIAHEINNPMSFVTANLHALSEDLAEVPELRDRLKDYVEDILPATLGGVLRVNAIVADLRRFSREDPGHFEEFDLNAEVEAALRIAGGQLLHRIEVVKRLGRLSPALGRPLGLPRQSGHRVKGSYGVRHGRREEAEATAQELHGRVQGGGSSLGARGGQDSPSGRSRPRRERLRGSDLGRAGAG
jgi:hypothetical protein